MGPSQLLGDRDRPHPCTAVWCGLAGQEGTGTLRPARCCLLCTQASSFCSWPQYRVALAPAAPRPGLWPLRLGAGSDARSPHLCLPGSRAAPSLTSPHRRPCWGLEALGCSPAVVPGVSTLLHPPPCKVGATLPPPHQPLSRAVPDCPFHRFATSGTHLALPAPPGTVPLCLLIPGPSSGHPCSVACCMSTWVPGALCCACYMDAAAVRWPEPAGSSEGPCAASLHFP